MQQYLELLQAIKKKGTYKPAARAGMPGSLSLFGYQLRHNLQDGFPLLTTKKMFWKGVVTELIWFLKGDTNIKYLVDNGVNIWNEDAYQYYRKQLTTTGTRECLSLEAFIEAVKSGDWKNHKSLSGYTLGDCGYQYGRVWRNWEKYTQGEYITDEQGFVFYRTNIDQIANVIKSLKETPESRRHIVTAIDPAHDQDLALYWCHTMFQFNCRPMSLEQRWYKADIHPANPISNEEAERMCDKLKIPKYYLDCQLYQRAADVFLGVPFNIASYALLTHIIANIVGMIPGELITSYGDVHIYDNHMDAVNEQLKRTPEKLPKLEISRLIGEYGTLHFTLEDALHETTQYRLLNYNPQPAIKAELSTGLQQNLKT